jgi:hypothetical protein
MKKNIWLRLLVSVMLLALMATMMVACKKDPENPDDPDKGPGILTPDYPAPPEEEGGEDIGDDEEKLETPEGGGAVGLVYSDKVTIDLSDKKATFRFDNPSRSTNNMELQLLIQDIVVMKSGTLTPGKRLTSLDLDDAVLAQLAPGVYGSTSNAKFRVYFYDPVTNERAVVNSEIAVTVTVQE